MATILVVDDTQTDRELIGRIVTKAGHSPVYAADGEEAITKAKQVKPSMIFMDVVMPNLDGFNACRRLKKEPDTAQIPIVLVTSKGTATDKFWGKKQGAEDYIVKPFTPDDVTNAIRQYVR